MKTTLYSVLIIFLLLFNSFSFAQVPGYDEELITTETMLADLTNIGILSWYPAIVCLDGQYGDYDVVYAHGIWVTGFISDSLIGTSSGWYIDYSPGPIIDGQAAMVIHTEDSTNYRVYHIDTSSGPGDPDYDEWPIQLGAPHYPDGSPLVYGEQTTYMVYNDAHPGEQYLGWPITGPTPLEIHETVWDYGDAQDLENIIFFRYQVYNRGEEDITETALAFWTDIDLIHAVWNYGGYNPDGNYMFMYFHDNNYSGLFPRACTYVLLQGPAVPSPGDTAISFGQEISDAVNLPTTSGYYVYTAWYYEDPEPFWPSYPYDLAQLRNACTGLWAGGEPIIHPITGDTTTYMYDGDPVTGEGWLWQIGYHGGAGFISSSSTFDLPAGDSTEVIYALVVVPSDSFQNALTGLENQVIWLKGWWAENWLTVEEDNGPYIPNEFQLLQAYPNPFNNSTVISFQIPKHEYVNVAIFDIMGRQIRRVFEGSMHGTSKQIVWDGKNELGNEVASGTYIYCVQTKHFINSKKMTFLQ